MGTDDDKALLCAFHILKLPLQQSDIKPLVNTTFPT